MLLDRVYELEGLLLLMEQRNDLPDNFRNLIIDKARSILAEAEKMEMSPKPEEPTTTPIDQITPIAPITPTAPAPAPNTTPSIRFPLNDRIRFSRELFGGDTARFDSTIAFVESLPEWPDVEDYFYADLAWDPARPEVAEFTEMLRHLFTMQRKGNTPNTI